MKPICELTRKYKVEEVNGNGYRHPLVVNAQDANHAVHLFVRANQTERARIGFLDFIAKAAYTFKVTVLSTGETLEFRRKF